jgi:hypothetical protein
MRCDGIFQITKKMGEAHSIYRFRVLVEPFKSLFD